MMSSRCQASVGQLSASRASERDSVPTRKTVLLISSDIRVRAAVIPHANILHLKVDNLASLPAQSDDRQTRLRHEYRVVAMLYPDCDRARHDRSRQCLAALSRVP